MSATLAPGAKAHAARARPQGRSAGSYRLSSLLGDGGMLLIGVVILIWTLLPIYHMVMLALTPLSGAFAGRFWPDEPTLENFRIVFMQDHFFLQNFWRQLGNSIFVAVATMVMVLVVASMASFAIGRLKVRFGHVVSNTALLTYLIPAAFLAVPFYVVMADYRLINTLWALIFAMSTFAIPYAIWVLRQYSESVPFELDEAAKVDGATPVQIFYLVYIPLLRPALIAIGTYALLLAWNEYLYAFLLLSTEVQHTIPVAMGYFLVTDDAPWTLADGDRDHLLAAARSALLRGAQVHGLGPHRRRDQGLTHGGLADRAHRAARHRASDRAGADGGLRHAGAGGSRRQRRRARLARLRDAGSGGAARGAARDPRAEQPAVQPELLRPRRAARGCRAPRPDAGAAPALLRRARHRPAGPAGGAGAAVLRGSPRGAAERGGGRRELPLRPARGRRSSRRCCRRASRC